MLDDINSELLSIYPGTFPKPIPYLKKFQAFDGGFHLYVRPPFPVFNVQCKNDYIEEKSKKAEAAIRKIYKAAATTNSSSNFKESSTIFQHGVSTESFLANYREAQIYSKSRMRKINKKQLMKAVMLARRKEDMDLDAFTSKTDVQSESGKIVFKPRISRGPKKELTKVRSKNVLTLPKFTRPTKKVNVMGKNKLEYGISAIDAEDAVNNETSFDELDVKVRTKSKSPLTVKKTVGKKTAPSPVTNILKDSSRNGQPLRKISESTLKGEDENFDGVFPGVMPQQKKLPIKQGNYTKIVTLKKKSMFRQEVPVEISTFSFCEPKKCQDVGVLQKVRKEERNNEIEHLYKINEISPSYAAQKRCATAKGLRKTVSKPKLQITSKSITKFDTGSEGKRSNRSTAGENEGKIGLMSSADSQDYQSPVPEEISRPNKSNAPLVCQQGKNAHRNVPRKSVVTISNSMVKLRTKSNNLPRIEASVGSRSGIRAVNTRRPPAKKEERCLQLPKITPNLIVIEPEEVLRNRKKNNVGFSPLFPIRH